MYTFNKKYEKLIIFIQGIWFIFPLLKYLVKLLLATSKSIEFFQHVIIKNIYKIQ